MTDKSLTRLFILFSVSLLLLLVATAVLSLELIQKGEGSTLSGRVDAGKYLTAPTVRSGSSMGSGRFPHDSTKVFINPNAMAKTWNVSIHTKEIKVGSQVIIPYHKVRARLLPTA